jgi:hypothetical protein
VLAAGPVVVVGPADLAGPLRLEITVSGARRGHEINVAARIVGQGTTGWNLPDPVVLPGPGRLGFDLARLPAGQHDIILAAWTPDGTATPASVTLPRLTIRPAA